MARPATSLNFKALNSELHASDAAIDKVLTAAKVSTVKVDGKDVAVSEAPLPARIAALGDLIAKGDSTQDTAQLQDANGQLAAQLEDVNNKLVAANATISAQASKINEATGQINILEAANTKLTAEAMENGRLLKASTDEGIRLSGIVASQKLALAKDCLAWGCVDFKGADGKALAKDATDAQLAESAKGIEFKDLHTAHKGAVTAAAAKVGVQLNAVPASSPNVNSTPRMAREEFLKLEPKAQTEFFKNGGKITEPGK